MVEKSPAKRQKTASVARALNCLQKMLPEVDPSRVVPDFSANTVLLKPVPSGNPGLPAQRDQEGDVAMAPAPIQMVEMKVVGRLDPIQGWQWMRGPLTSAFPKLNMDKLAEEMSKGAGAMG